MVRKINGLAIKSGLKDNNYASDVQEMYALGRDLGPKREK